jgi:hypothetical protein
VTIHSILDWLRCILAICDLLPHPHNSILQVQIDFMTVLYRSILLSSNVGDFLQMIQYKTFTFRSICFFFFFWSVCCVHVSLESKCRPRYFAVGDRGD